MKKQTPKAKPEVKPIVADRQARAKVTYLRISPRKVRIVIDTIRHQPVTVAFARLMALKKKAARFAEKVLKTAVANAKVLGMEENRLYVSDVRADGGPVMKRFMERSMGRANRILKRTTHLSMIVKEGQKSWGEAPAPEAAAQDEKSGKAGKPKFSFKKKAAQSAAAKA